MVNTEPASTSIHPAPTGPVSGAPAAPAATQIDPVRSADVIIRLIDGRALAGTVARADGRSLRLRAKGGGLVVLYRHAVAGIEAACAS